MSAPEPIGYMTPEAISGLRDGTSGSEVVVRSAFEGYSVPVALVDGATQVVEKARALAEFLWGTDLRGVPFHLVSDLRAALAALPAAAPTALVAELRVDMKGGGYVHWLSDAVFDPGTKLYATPPTITEPAAESALAERVPRGEGHAASAQMRPSRRDGGRRQQLESTPEGRAVLVAAKRRLGDILAADHLVPMAALRLQRGLSQQQLADLTGIPQPQLSQIEAGHHDIKATTAMKLAIALGVSAGAVIEAVLKTRPGAESDDV